MDKDLGNCDQAHTCPRCGCKDLSIQGFSQSCNRCDFGWATRHQVLEQNRARALHARVIGREARW